MKKIALVLLTASLLVLAPVALADTITIFNPLCPTGTPSSGTPSANCINDFAGLIAKITQYIVDIIGAVAVLMFVWAGILFVTAGVNPSQVAKAKSVLWYAIIGLAITLAASGLIAVIKAVLNVGP